MQLDQLIDLMNQKGATQLVMASAAPPRILAYGQWISAGGAPFSAQRLETLLQIIAPPHLQSELAKPNAALEWEHFAAGGKYRIQIHGAFEKRTLTLTQQIAARASTPATPHAARQASAVAAQAPSTLTPPVLPTASPSTPAVPPPLPHNANSASTPPPLPLTISPPHAVTTSSPEEYEQRTRNWQPPTAAEERTEKILVRSVAILIPSLILGLIVYGILYSHNGKKDYSRKFSIEVTEKYNGDNSNVSLGLSDVQLEKQTWSYYKGSFYKGKGRFRNGDSASVEVKILKRDRLNRPAKWNWTVVPYDYGSLMADPIQKQANSVYAARGTRIRVRSISLERKTRTDYHGTVKFNDDGLGYINVSVSSFNAKGEPNDWNYSISTG